MTWRLPKSERKKRRRELNEKDFPSERWFMNQLKRYGATNLPERNMCLIGRYFGDFVWIRERVVVEIDGAIHIGKQEYDKKRDSELKAAGYKVIRIWFPDYRGASLEFFKEHHAMLMRGSKNLKNRKLNQAKKDPEAFRNSVIGKIQAERNKKSVENHKERSAQFVNALKKRKREERMLQQRDREFAVQRYKGIVRTWRG